MNPILSSPPQTSKRYHFRKPAKKSSSPVPEEYEIPINSISSAAYETLQRTDNEGRDTNEEYAKLNPSSLDEPSYYTTTHSSSPFKNARKEDTEGEDVGGVNMYLEVLPSDKNSPSPRGESSTSPRGGLPLALTNSKSTPEDLSSPDILDGDLVDPYDYVNTDLGPQAI